jgi:hypothetical protein
MKDSKFQEVIWNISHLIKNKPGVTTSIIVKRTSEINSSDIKKIKKFFKKVNATVTNVTKKSFKVVFTQKS